MTCAELKEQCAAWALGALEADEQAAAQAHLAGAGPHEGCHEALAQARRTIDALGAALPPEAPAAGTWAAIERAIGAEAAVASVATAAAAEIPTPAASLAPAAPVAASPTVGARAGAAEIDTTTAPRPRPAKGRARRLALGALPWTLLAAAALYLFWMSGRLGEERRGRADLMSATRAAVQGHEQARAFATVASEARVRCEADLRLARDQLDLQTKAVAMLEHPATRVVSFEAKGTLGSRATAIVNLHERQGMVVASGVQAPAGKDYELWVIKGDQKLAAGLLRGTGDGRIMALIDPALLAGGADTLAVTLEPAGGGPVPLGEVVLVAALPQS